MRWGGAVVVACLLVATAACGGSSTRSPVLSYSRAVAVVHAEGKRLDLGTPDDIKTTGATAVAGVSYGPSNGLTVTFLVQSHVTVPATGTGKNAYSVGWKPDTFGVYSLDVIGDSEAAYTIISKDGTSLAVDVEGSSEPFGSNGGLPQVATTTFEGLIA